MKAAGRRSDQVSLGDSLSAEELALRRAIAAAERELGAGHPTTRQLVARRVSLLIRLGRDAEAAWLGAGGAGEHERSSRTMDGEDGGADE